MRPFRILHVVPYYEQAWAYGGIPRLATAMTRALARRGHYVSVCTTDAGDEYERATAGAGTRTEHGVEVRTFRNISNHLAYHWQFFTPVGLWSHLRASLRGEAPRVDVAHLHACHNLPGAIAAAALARAGVPYVVSPNGTAKPIERRIAAKRLFSATIGRGVLGRAARILAVSDAERRQLTELGITPERIALVPNPVDAEEFASPAEPGRFRRRFDIGGAPVVLFLGKLTPRKSVDVLVRAFARLPVDDVRLVIAGNDMGAGKTIDAVAEGSGLGDRIVRTGLLRGRERLDALSAAAVLVYPSRDEIFGLVPLESLMCGTPVVVSNDSGCGEVIGRVGGGHIVPHGDTQTLAGAIASILESPDLWRTRARSAATRVAQAYGSDPVSRLLEEVYGSVVH